MHLEKVSPVSSLHNSITVAEIVGNHVISVEPTTKLDSVARIFEEHNINAAPVVDGFGKCIGIITSRDLVRYESVRVASEQQFKHGIAFDLNQTSDDACYGIYGQPFDQVAYHMSVNLISVKADIPLLHAGRIMYQSHIHHLLVLDDFDRPVGILSSLDVLGSVLDDAATFNQSESTVG